MISSACRLWRVKQTILSRIEGCTFLMSRRSGGGYTRVGACTMGRIGLPEMLIILAIALVIFGPRKLPDLGRSLGHAIRGFKDAIQEGEDKNTKT